MFEDKLKTTLKKQLKLKEVNLEIPPENYGDYALPCFQYSKQFKKQANEIAVDFSKKVKVDFIEKVEVKGPYLNFYVKKEILAKEVLSKILKEKEKYASNKNKKTIVIESPGPNTNKPLHLGHLRNMALGISLSNIFKKLGNKVVNVDIINDRGIHICKSVLAYKKYGNNKQPDKKSDHFVGDYYVLYSKKLEKNPDLEKETQEMLRKYEEKDKTTLRLWEKMNRWAINGLKETYKRFGMNIDNTYEESKHYEKGKELVLDAFKKGIFKKNKDGAIVINLKKQGLGEKVLLREDGTSIYITQDIYLAKKRYEDFKMDKMIYIVGSEQIYHFNVLFKVLEALNYKFVKNFYHLPYGMVYLPEGKMKSRIGTVVDADDILGEVINLAKKEIEKRHKNVSKKDIEKRAEIIGLGALKFFILKYDALKDFTYNPKESIEFEGETAPYIQYAYARINSILKKENYNGEEADYSLLKSTYEVMLIKHLSLFPNIIKEAANKLKPNIIANYSYELSKLFSEFYHNCPVLKAEKELKQARKALIFAISVVLKSSLDLLGIETLKEM